MNKQFLWGIIVGTVFMLVVYLGVGYYLVRKARKRARKNLEQFAKVLQEFKDFSDLPPEEMDRFVEQEMGEAISKTGGIRYCVDHSGEFGTSEEMPLVLVRKSDKDYVN